ncbi:MAG: heparinase II/III-family protein [Clostridia bacterium]|nr:heparinase II/III-family protein [Clostridia bacterium]
MKNTEYEFVPFSGEVTQNNFKEELNNGFYIPPQFYFSSKEIPNTAKSITEGVLFVHRAVSGVEYDLETFDWNLSVSKQAETFQLYLQALTPVAVLARAYEMTGNRSFLEFAERMIIEWWKYASDKKSSDENRRVWTDHSVALRTEILMYFGRVIKTAGYGSDELYSSLYDILNIQGKWLYETPGYAKNHNHGIMHDKGLLFLSVQLKKKEWYLRAKNRILTQEKWAFAADNVHKENSPAYTGVARNWFIDIGTFLSEWGDPAGDKILKDMERVQEYIDWATKPNGIIAQVGDTGNIPGKKYGYPDKMKRRSKDIHAMFPVSGIYFYRSNIDSESMLDTWKTIKSGFVRKTHKHADDGSFILYSKGYEIFVDCGVYGYANDDFRKYIISAKAHNTVIVDDESYDIDEKNAERAGVEGWAFFEEYDHIRTFNNIYPGVQIKRDFCSADDLTIIYDSLESEQQHTYSQLFHLGEDISVLSSDDREVVMQIADTDHIVRIRQHGSPVKLSILCGDLSKSDYGLISRGINHLDVISTLKFDISGTNAEFITSITIEDTKGNIRLYDKTVPVDSLVYKSEERTFEIDSLRINCKEELFSAGQISKRVSYGNDKSDAICGFVYGYGYKVVENELRFSLDLKEDKPKDVEFAYYLLSGGKILRKAGYSKCESVVFDEIKRGNSYRIKYFIKRKTERMAFVLKETEDFNI